MNKLYFEISGGYNEEIREYEICDELAELLKQWAHCDEQTDEEKMSNEIELDLSDEELDDLGIYFNGFSQQVTRELNSIFDDAETEGYELAVASFLETDPPTEFFFDKRMPEDIEAGLFTPSLSFEQYLEKEGWDTSDEDYDEEIARDEYDAMVYDEYQEWVETLKPTDRAERYGLEYDAPIPERHFRFLRIVKKADEQL